MKVLGHNFWPFFTKYQVIVSKKKLYNLTWSHIFFLGGHFDHPNHNNNNKTKNNHNGHFHRHRYLVL